MTRILLEVCTATHADALAAAEGGADRLELNSALELGGLTPSLGVFLQIRQQLAIPLCVMIRPRPGAFAYSDAEFASIRAEAKWFLDHGADAIVLGVLTPGGEVDLPRCRELIGIAGPQKAIFHRAFDLVPRPLESLEQLIDLGFARIMTSGQEPTTSRGVSLIAELIRQAAGRIEILPAGGVTPENVGEIVGRTGCDQVHASLRSDRHDPSAAHRPLIRFGTSGEAGEGHFRGTDASLVRRMRRELDALHEPNGET